MTNEQLKAYDDTGELSGPIDPDIALISDYLVKALSADEAEAVERRLADDEEFFEKVWPLVRAWRLPAGSRAAGNAPARRESHHRDISFERRLRRNEFWANLTLRANAMLRIAAVFSLVTGVSSWAYLAIHEVPQDTVVVKLDRAPTGKFPHPTRIETGAAETKEITMRGGSRLVLRGNSRLTYEYAGVPGIHLVGAALDGELAVDLTAQDRTMTVTTSAGDVLFTPGSYAVRCEPGCAAMLVTVGAGMAGIRSDSGKAVMTLRAGDKGRVPKHGPPEKVSPGDGWPALEPPKAAGNGTGGRGGPSPNPGR